MTTEAELIAQRAQWVRFRLTQEARIMNIREWITPDTEANAKRKIKEADDAIAAIDEQLHGRKQ